TVYAGLTNDVHLPLMNTGDIGSRFNVDLAGLPPGWQSTPESARWLDQHVENQTSTFLRVPDGASGRYTLSATARSSTPSLSSSCAFDVNVQPRPVYGYVWADQPAAASYTPASPYQKNSSFTANTVRRNGIGSYTVRFPNLGTSGGMAHATAYGYSANR